MEGAVVISPRMGKTSEPGEASKVYRPGKTLLPTQTPSLHPVCVPSRSRLQPDGVGCRWKLAGGCSMTMIPQGRCSAATVAAWISVWALVASSASARSPEPPGSEGAAASRGIDGGQRQAGAESPTGDPAASKNAQVPSSPGAVAPERTASPAAAKRADTGSKPAATAKDGSASNRRGVTTGSGNRSLAAEKAAIDGVKTKTSIDEILARTLPLRSDRVGDWSAGAEPLHHCGEPRWIDPCIPLPPCHPSYPPHPWDLVGVVGEATCGPIYRGPCCPRTGTHDGDHLPRLHRINDRFFDAFYRTK